MRVMRTGGMMGEVVGNVSRALHAPQHYAARRVFEDPPCLRYRRRLMRRRAARRRGGASVICLGGVNAIQDERKRRK